MFYKNTTDFLNLLFRPSDFVWVVNRFAAFKKSVSLCEAQEITKNMLPSEDGWTIALNPAKELGMNHGQMNVCEYRNFLFEMDDKSLNKQLEIIEYFKIPYSSLVFSGNKSLHMVISLDEPAKDIEEYKAIHLSILQAANSIFDPQTNSPSTFTRIPGGRRFKGGEIREQNLIKLKEKVKRRDILRFLEKKQTRRWEYKEALKNLRRIEHPKKFSQDDLNYIFGSYIDLSTKVQHRGDQYSLPCPNCRLKGEDRTGNNLSINMEKLLAHCFKQCDFKEVISAMKEYIHYE
jgi:hypothetical protein